MGSIVSLVLMICKTIFGVGKAVVFYSGFCVSKVISEKKSKVIYAGDLIKKQLYYPKGGPGGNYWLSLSK